MSRLVRQWWTGSDRSRLLASEHRLLSALVKHPFQKPSETIDGQQGINMVEFRASSGSTGLPTVVLAHGFGSGLVFFYRNIDSLLSSGKVSRVVCVDWLGMGGSNRPPCWQSPIRSFFANDEPSTPSRFSLCNSKFSPSRAIDFFLDPFDQMLRSGGVFDHGEPIWLDVDVAVEAATAAFKKWRDVSGPARRDLLLKLADLIEENQQFLAEVESQDNGKPVSTARDVDIGLAIKHFRYYAGWADKIHGKTIPAEDTSSIAMTLHEPVGVVGCIIPWNFPLLMFTWKVAPLLAAGCTCVLKSSEKTPLTALLMGKLIHEAGFPPGVVNVLSGYGPDCGSAIAKHPGIDKVAFTGSTAVGHKIVQYSAESNLKRVTLELGGKSPLIVCDDADLEAAADVAHIGLFLNHGQCCCASSRIFVDEKIYDKFAKMCIERAQKIDIGTEEGKFQGPQVDDIQFEKILGFIDSGKKEGAKCMLGGNRCGSKGYYVEPTIFTEVTDEMKIAKEEIFGPVMQLMKFKTIEEAIERANATNYGLAAGVCSQNIARAMGIAKRLRAGTVWINNYDNFDAAFPFGGYKESGWGRDKGEYALENYMEVKMVSFPINNYQ